MSEGSPTRGEIWDVNLDPTVGSEIRKRRPCLVISTSAFDQLPIRMIVPFTSWQARFAFQPNRVPVEATPDTGLSSRSACDGLQTRAVSLQRFGSGLGVVDDLTLAAVAARLAQVVEYSPP